MNVEELREFCLSFQGVQENRPWSEPQYEMLITYSVGGKWFCLFNPDEKFVDVKCQPVSVLSMQDNYTGAFPAWHMNKTHWLGLKLDSDIPDSKIKELLKAGYDLIVGALPKKTRTELGI